MSSSNVRNIHGPLEIRSLHEIVNLMDSLRPICEYWEGRGSINYEVSMDISDIAAELGDAYVALINAERKINEFIEEQKNK